MSDTTGNRERDRETVDRQRRTVLIGGGLVVPFVWLATTREAHAFASPRPQAGDDLAARADGRPAFAPNAFIRIDRDGVVRLVMPEVEMGQGSYTGQAMLIADELGVDLDQVRVEHAPPNEALYALEIQGGQYTGTSNTIRGSWAVLREAGAVARTMLVAAAAERWHVDPARCHVDRGVVYDPAGRKLTFGELAEAASRQPVPAKVTLAGPSNYRLIGKRLKRLDTPAKVDGSMTYGIDVRVPGMKVAAVRSCPTIGGRLRAVEASRARARAGVRDIVELHDAVAVIADDFWTARQALDELEPEWEAGPLARLSTERLRAEMDRSSAQGKPIVARDVGNHAAATTRRVDAVYTLPLLAHATMEPMNAVVWVRAGACDVWVGTQVPTRVVDAAVRITGVKADQVTVHNHYIGGGFGRRLEVDSVEQAIEIARHVSYPVKLVWTREQDVQHDFYRPNYHDHLTASLDDNGYPVTWWHRVTSDTVTNRWSPADMGKDGLDPDCVDGAIEPPYALPNLRVEWVRYDLPLALKIGWLRGVGQTHNLFPVESFVDELAHAAGKDPVAYRRHLLANNPRARAVLDLAAEKFGWNAAPAGARIGRGVAVGMPFNTYLCVIVEVEVSAEGEVRLRRAVAAVDCGTIVNPDTVEAQVQGGLMFGWTAALHGEISIRDGSVEQSNFNDYRVLRMSEAPRIEVHLVASNEPPTGIGEPPTSIAAPCLANAVFAATGVRVRSLPIARAPLASRAAATDRVET